MIELKLGSHRLTIKERTPSDVGTADGKPEFSAADLYRLAEKVFDVLETLSPQESEILQLRFGLDGALLTRRQTAERLDVPLSRVTRIERRAIRKLRDRD